MSTAAVEVSDTIGRTEQFSTRVAFFIAGFGGAVWAVLVPFAKTRAGLEAGGLGLLLLAFGIGSIIAMPLAGALAGKYGCRRVLIASSLMVCIALPALATVSNAGLLAVALFVLGAGVGSVDCVVNIQAVIVERAAGRALMSGFHGLFSVGGIAGAAGCAGLLSLGASPVVVSLVAIVFTAAMLAWAAPHFLTFGGDTSGPAFALPHGVVLFIGILCFIVFLTEGAILDWSAVFLTFTRGADPAHAGLGYAAFATTMTIGRLSGDAIVRRVSRTTIILVGGLLAASGLLIAMLVPSVPAALIAVTTLGYAGILMGPASIGFVAHVASLPVAFLIIAVFLIGVAASGRFLKA
ncbi:MAG: transporter [Proteobacteria bacterium]|nr:transporter [Pseudomonadota bacterium]